MKILKLFPVLLLLAACSNVTNEEQASDTDDSASFEVTQQNFNKQVGDCSTDTSVYCTKVIFNYPEIQGDETVASTINRELQSRILKEYLNDSINSTFEGYSEQFIQDYKKIKSRFDQAFGWYSIVDSRQVRQDSVLVLKTDLSLYTGGAHGMDAVYYLNFDLATGKVLKLTDIFKQGFENRLNIVVSEAFKESKTHHETDRYFTDNFGLLPDGLVFYFNAYEMAPYASGVSSVEIPYSKVESILQNY